MAYKLDLVSLRKLQLAELECLREVKRICEENNIPYFLIGGTLIGAVRHKGFIPWDDDIDIGMLREDYDKFCEICPKVINSDKFFFQIPQFEDGNADYEIARIRLNNTHFVQRHRKNLKSHDGIFIEIIPYDDLPASEKTAARYSKNFKRWKRMVGIRMGYEYEISKRPFYQKLFYFRARLSSIVPLKIAHKYMINYHKKFMNTNSEKVFLLAGAYDYKKESHLRDTVSNYTTLEFEGEVYPVPKNYDLFLKEQYGEYMLLPPRNKRVNKCWVENLDFGPYQYDITNVPEIKDDYPLEKIQRCLMIILREIKRICDKNNIPYFMIGGTLLGAVRHQGFIPWDDDVDLGMLRKDYERFIVACETDLDKEHFFIQRVETDPEYGKFYIRVLLNGTSINYDYIWNSKSKKSIFVDLFPYDSAPRTFILQKLQCIQTNCAMRMMKKKVHYSGYADTIGAKIEYALEPHLSRKQVIKLYENGMQFYNFLRNTKYVNCSNAGYGYFKELLERKWVAETKPMKFGDIELPGSVYYDEYLTHLYGDYMTLPPVEKQVTHGFQYIDFGPYENI